MAGRLSLPALWRQRVLAEWRAYIAAMQSVQLPGFSNRRNADASQSISVEGVVLGRLLGGHRHPGHERYPTSAPDGM